MPAAPELLVYEGGTDEIFNNPFGRFADMNVVWYLNRGEQPEEIENPLEFLLLDFSESEVIAEA